MPGEDAFELSHPFVNGQPRPVRPGDGGGCVMDYSWLLVIPIGCFVFCLFAPVAWPMFKDWLDD